ncbi:MAG: aryl-sulfate sulfotransferase [Lachnospiraceae bacterium]|nr:aryl-sulfate sulfotransferase [Lachnospiraceae bacterium]
MSIINKIKHESYLLFADPYHLLKNKAIVKDRVWLKTVIPFEKNDYIDTIETNITNRQRTQGFFDNHLEMAIDHLKMDPQYTFNRPLYIKNPFLRSLLTGVLIFTTKDKCKVEYTVKGQKKAKDVTFCDNNLTKHHRTAIFGLYADVINHVYVVLKDEKDNIITSRNLKLPGLPLPEESQDLVKPLKATDEFDTDFVLVTGGYHGDSFMMDEAGNVRYFHDYKPQFYGVYNLDDTNFIFPTRGQRRAEFGNGHSIVSYVTDFFGRYHYTLLNEKGFHHWSTMVNKDDTIYILSSSLYDENMENSIMKLNVKTGEVLEEYNMNDYFDDTYKTRNDWCHVNSVQYLEEDNSLILSMRNIHTVGKFNLDKPGFEWLIANPDFYKDTEQKDLVLTPDTSNLSEDFSWFFQQHCAMPIKPNNGDKNRLYVAIFDNHTANRRPVSYFDKDKHSYALVYSIDEKKKEIRLEKRIKLPLAQTRSSVRYEEKSNRLFICCANRRDKDYESLGAMVFEYDYDTCEMISQYEIKNDCFQAFPVSPNITELSSSLPHHDTYSVGKVCDPYKLEKDNEDYDLIVDSLIKKTLKTTNVAESTDEFLQVMDFRLVGDLLQIYGKDHDFQKIILYNKDDIYVQDFTDSYQPLPVFYNEVYYQSMPLNILKKAHYNIAIKYEGKIYTSDYYITLS